MTTEKSPLIISVIISIAITAGYVLNVNNVFGSNGYLTYQNPDYNLQIDYPANWTKSEINLSPYMVAFFYPPNLTSSEGLFERLTKPNIPPVILDIEVYPRTSANINESVTRVLSAIAGNNQSRLVNHNSTMLSGVPAYQFVAYDYSGDETRKELSLWAPNGNNSYSVVYRTEPGYFSQYLPDAKRMIDSFVITNSCNNSQIHQ